MTLYAEEVLKLLGEILSESSFTESALSDVKAVTIEDCENSLAYPSYALHENIHRTTFKDHPFGNFVKGNPKTLREVTRTQLVEFVTQQYIGPNIIVSSSGGLSHESLVNLTEKYFWRIQNMTKSDVSAPNYTPNCIQSPNEDETTYLAIAYPGPSIKQNQFIAFQLLETLMSNSIDLPYIDYAKQRNYLHNQFSQIGGLISHNCLLTSYSDCGLFIHFLECEPLAAPFLGSAVIKAMLRNTKEISSGELERAKNTFLNKMLLLETSSQIAQQNANQIRLLGSKRSKADIASHVIQYQSNQLVQVYDPWINSLFPVLGIYGNVVSENIAEIIYKECGGKDNKK